MGRPAKYDHTTREAAHLAYLAGDTSAEIAARIGCTDRTVRLWIKDGGWRAELARRRQSVAGLEAQIHRLTQPKHPTASQTQRLAMLTKSLERLRKATPKPKPRPVVRDAMHAELLHKAIDDDYGLQPYQREVLTSADRFRIYLKARQIGFSYVVGLACVLAAANGRPQLVASASLPQAKIILGHVLLHAGRLGIAPDDHTADTVTIHGTEIRVVSTNWRTAQGWAGDVWFDEFAWVRQQKLLWGALVPSITRVGGRVTLFSTPFLPGSFFWQLAENHRGAWGRFARHTITIHNAIEQGMPLPGGIAELRALFDAETWAMFQGLLTFIVRGRIEAKRARSFSALT